VASEAGLGDGGAVRASVMHGNDLDVLMVLLAFDVPVFDPEVREMDLVIVTEMC
jgi:hypothetical protein